MLKVLPASVIKRLCCSTCVATTSSRATTHFISFPKRCILLAKLHALPKRLSNRCCHSDYPVFSNQDNLLTEVTESLCILIGSHFSRHSQQSTTAPSLCNVISHPSFTRVESLISEYGCCGTVGRLGGTDRGISVRHRRSLAWPIPAGSYTSPTMQFRSTRIPTASMNKATKSPSTSFKGTWISTNLAVTSGTPSILR